MSFFTLIIIGISLSLDAFSLSILYGTFIFSKEIKLFLSSIVGIFHFFMPILGSLIGAFIITNIISTPDIIVGIIFTILSIEMFLSIKDLDKQTKKFKNLLEAFLFAFSVSLDSFTVGIALGTHNENIVLAGIVFAVLSFTFTFIGLNIGRRLSIKYGKFANIIGSIMLFLLGLTYFFE